MKNLLNINSIKKQLQNPRRFNIEILNSIPSTNDYLKVKPIINHTAIDVCIAEEQTAGRGRFEKKWFSPKQENIYVSILFTSQKPLRELTNLSTIVAQTLIEALTAYGIENNLQIKPPNDIHCDGKKLAGILIETRAIENGLLPIIIGIGLNVNMESAPLTAIEQNWTSLKKLTHKTHNRNKIAGILIQKIIEQLQWHTIMI